MPSCRRCSTGAQQRRPIRDQHGGSTDPHEDRVRHGRMAGSDGGRVHVRERAPLRGRGGPLRRGPRGAGEGRGHRVRPTVRVGALRQGGRRGAARPRDPGRDQPHRRAHPDEPRSRSWSGAQRPGSSSPPRTIHGPTTASRSRRRPAQRPVPTSSRSWRRRSPPTAARRSSAAPSRTRRPPARSSGTTRIDGYEQFVRTTLDIDALKAADVSVLVEPLYGAGRGLDPAPARRRADPGHRDPRRAQPVLRGRQPGAHPAQRGRGAGPDRRGRLRSRVCSSMATPTAQGRPTSAARSSTSWRSRAC